MHEAAAEDTLRRALVSLVIGFAAADLFVILAGTLFRHHVFFNLAEENNLPTWYSSAQLLAVSAVAAAIGWVEAARGLGRWSRLWFLWAAGFALLSCDETAGLHERIGHRLSGWLGVESAGGSAFSGWVVVLGPAMLAVMAGLIVFLYGRLRSCPWALAGMALGAGLWVLALVLEFLEEPFPHEGADPRLDRVLEEGAEIVGATLWLACLTYYLYHLIRRRIVRPA